MWINSIESRPLQVPFFGLGAHLRAGGFENVGVKEQDADGGVAMMKVSKKMDMSLVLKPERWAPGGSVPKAEFFNSLFPKKTCTSANNNSLDLFFTKQFTVGVLNATLDLAALVLVGVVGFLGSEVVLSGGCWLVWPPSWALKWSCLPLSPVVSGCLRLSPFMWGVGVGWCGRLLGL